MGERTQTLIDGELRQPMSFRSFDYAFLFPVLSECDLYRQIKQPTVMEKEVCVGVCEWMGKEWVGGWVGG